MNYLKKLILILAALPFAAAVEIKGSQKKPTPAETNLNTLIENNSYLEPKYALWYHWSRETMTYSILSTENLAEIHTIKNPNEADMQALNIRFVRYQNASQVLSVDDIREKLESLSGDQTFYYCNGTTRDTYRLFSSNNPFVVHTVYLQRQGVTDDVNQALKAFIFDKQNSENENKKVQQLSSIKEFTETQQKLCKINRSQQAARMQRRELFTQQHSATSTATTTAPVAAGSEQHRQWGGGTYQTVAAASTTGEKYNNDDDTLDWGDGNDNQVATAATALLMPTSGITLTTPSATAGLSACPANNVQSSSATTSTTKEHETEQASKNTESPTTATDAKNKLQFLDDQYSLHWATILNENGAKTFACFSTYDKKLHTFTKDNSAFSNAILARIKKNVNSTKHTDYSAFTAALEPLQHEQTATATTSQKASQPKKRTLQERFREEDAQYVIKETTADMEYWTTHTMVCRQGPIILFQDGQICHTEKAVKLYESYLALTDKHLFPPHLLPIFKAFNNKKSYPQSANVGPEYLAKNWETCDGKDRSENAFRKKATQLKAAWEKSIAPKDSAITTTSAVSSCHAQPSSMRASHHHARGSSSSATVASATPQLDGKAFQKELYEFLDPKYRFYWCYANLQTGELSGFSPFDCIVRTFSKNDRSPMGQALYKRVMSSENTEKIDTLRDFNARQKTLSQQQSELQRYPRGSRSSLIRSSVVNETSTTPLFENYLQATLLASIAAAATYTAKDARMLVFAAPLIAFSYREKEDQKDQIDYSAWLTALEKRYNDFVNRHPKTPKKIVAGIGIATVALYVGYGASWYTGRFADRLPFMKTVFAPACDTLAQKIVNPFAQSIASFFKKEAEKDGTELISNLSNVIIQ